MPEQTPALDEFIARYEADDNEWWRIECGHHQNLFEEAVEDRERLRKMLRWALTEGHEEFGQFLGTDVPDHFCAFTHRPDTGSCALHEQWVEAADACGVLAEMTEDATPLRDGETK